MNELELSVDLNEIELEIQWHKENAGKSVWEIGRRLNHVKENDLAHGQFIDWIENKLKINRTTANRFMKVAKELSSNDAALNHLGSTALYLIATLPEEEREKEHTLDSGKTKSVDEMTTRELEEVKRKNKQQERRIKELENQEPEVIEVEKEVTKEVVPPDYDGLKSDNQQLSQALHQAQKAEKTTRLRNERIEKERDELQEQLNSVDEKSEKYDQLNEAVQELNGQLTEGQKRIQAQKNVYELIKDSEQMLKTIAPLPYLIDMEYIRDNEHAIKALNKTIHGVETWLDNMNKLLNKPQIIEGVFTDE